MSRVAEVVGACQTSAVATIHHTTLSPSKLELITDWLPRQPWYRGGGRPVLAKSGGFRLDDPAGEVGIEIAIVADADGSRYLVPMSYRGAPIAGADEVLIGTSEHGVLGRRWIYDAVHDPVAVSQLLALIGGQVHAQRQDLSDTVDASVRSAPPLPFAAAQARPPSVVDENGRTSIALVPDDLSLHVVRVLNDAGEPDGDLLATVQMDVPGAGRRAVVLVLRRAHPGV
jgi:hypothetical protein